MRHGRRAENVPQRFSVLTYYVVVEHALPCSLVLRLAMHFGAVSAFRLDNFPPRLLDRAELEKHVLCREGVFLACLVFVPRDPPGSTLENSSLQKHLDLGKPVGAYIWRPLLRK